MEDIRKRQPYRITYHYIHGDLDTAQLAEQEHKADQTIRNMLAKTRSKHILIVLKAVAALFGCGYGFFDFSLEKKIRKQ